jgi:hypothetical protein
MKFSVPRSRLIYAVAAVLVIICWVARAGNEADARARSRCAAIGREMQAQAASKRVEVGHWRYANPRVAAQWDDYLKRLDIVAASLVDAYAGPQPTRGEDRAWAHQHGLQGLIRAARPCTGEKP